MLNGKNQQPMRYVVLWTRVDRHQGKSKMSIYRLYNNYKNPSIDYIIREDHGLVLGEVNVSGPEQGIPIKFTQALKSESFKTS